MFQNTKHFSILNQSITQYINFQTFHFHTKPTIPNPPYKTKPPYTPKKPTHNNPIDTQ